MTPPEVSSNQLAQQRTGLADDRTKLALDRTRMAHERTLMAWVRTATSLISFGFTIYKFFQYLRESQPAIESHRLFGPRAFALAMISLGVGSLVLATIQHRNEMAALQSQYGQYGKIPRSTAMIVATVVGGLGILALVMVFLHQ
jgi:inner membrane protein YidH